MELSPSQFRCPYVSGSLSGVLKMFVYLNNTLVAMGLTNNCAGIISTKYPEYYDALLVYFKTNFPEYDWM